jgi:hypothetical protein
MLESMAAAIDGADYKKQRFPEHLDASYSALLERPTANQAPIN